MRILVRAECFGEQSLTDKERHRYEELLCKEINLGNENQMDELIKKQQEVRKMRRFEKKFGSGLTS